MILTDFYRLKKLPEGKSKHRIDCTASTNSYIPFEEMRNKQGALFCYIGNNTHTKAGRERKTDLALSKTKHISSIYWDDITKPLAFGDVRGTKDAMLIVFTNVSFSDGAIVEGAIIDIYIARGQNHNKKRLYNMLVDGELNEDIYRLKKSVLK